MTDNNCAYCMEGELVDAFGIKICELPESKVYLFKEQSHKGRVIVAHKKHVSEMTELTAEERAAYFEDVTAWQWRCTKRSIRRRSTTALTVTPAIIFTFISCRNTRMNMSGAASLR